MRLNRGFSRTTFISVCASELPNDQAQRPALAARKWQQVKAH